MLENQVLDPVLFHTLRFALAILWGVAVFGKVRQFARFRRAVRGYRLLPEAAVPLIALSIPGVEALLAATLVWSATARPALLGSAILISCYTAALAVAAIRGTLSDCGCLQGGPPGRVVPWLILRNLLLIGVACVALLPQHARAVGVPEACLIVAGVIGLCLGYFAMSRLLAATPSEFETFVDEPQPREWG
ncbi:MAG: hypothetical protein H6978_15815 [Gammaproteobacteria bacterium]|nr:hypothetical protein [Gammaproteobacteria bacterium]